MNERLDAYLALERVMLALDERGDPLADGLRDLMDRIWYALADEEHALLDARAVAGAASLHPIRFPVGSHLFAEPQSRPPAGPAVHDRPVGVRLTGWRTAA